MRQFTRHIITVKAFKAIRNFIILLPEMFLHISANYSSNHDNIVNVPTLGLMTRLIHFDTFSMTE